MLKIPEKFPSRKECKKFNKKHFPWKSQAYKDGCKKIGCIYKKTTLGSSCRDPISVTRERISRSGLDDLKKLAMLTKTELEAVIKSNNAAGDVYFHVLMDEYGLKRHNVLTELASGQNISLLIQFDNIELFKIFNNALYDDIKGIIRFEILKSLKEEQQINCFYATLGDNANSYRGVPWHIVQWKLEKCGIYPGNELYSIAKLNYKVHNSKSRHMSASTSKSKVARRTSSATFRKSKSRTKSKSKSRR